MDKNKTLKYLQKEKERMEYALKTCNNNIENLKNDINTVEKLIVDLEGRN